MLQYTRVDVESLVNRNLTTVPAPDVGCLLRTEGDASKRDKEFHVLTWEELPAKGYLCALDAEFVMLCQVIL